MTGKLLHAGADRHYCRPPGWRERRRLRVKADARWQCECGKTYLWASDWDGGWCWERIHGGAQ